MIVDWSALAQVVVAGLIVGAGVPALFALGLRLLAGTTAEPADARRPADARGSGGSTSPEAERRPAGVVREPRGPVVIARPSPARLVGAVLCFGTVVGAIAAGLVFLAAGGH